MTQEWKEKRQKVVDWLFNTFPKAFEELKPLKVGIFNDIRDFKCDDKPALLWIRRALYMHTSRMTYLKNTKVGEPRIDLAGQVAGEVDLDEEENAQKIFKEKEAYNREKAKKRRATIAKIKRVKELKAKKSIQAIEPKKEEEVGEIGRQILTLKKKDKTPNSEPSGISKTKNILKEPNGPLLKIKKKKLVLEPEKNASQ